VNGKKSTVDEIRGRFDADVERFSNLEAGHSATIDAPLAMELIARAAALTNPSARHVLDVGCDGGHETRRLQPRQPAAVRCGAWLAVMVMCIAEIAL
jgi:tRNA (cmo5U34)-methyltransferase